MAPVVARGQREREVVFPKGKWMGDDGNIIQGPSVKMIVAPLERLPWFRKISE